MEDKPEGADSLNQQDQAQSQNAQEDSATSQPEAAPQEQEQVDVEDLKKRAALADDYKKRAEIAERENKTLKKPKAPSQDLSTKDVLTLVKAGVTEDGDVEEVVRAAKVLDKPLHEALIDPVVKGILNARAEERRSAQAASAGSGARGSSKIDGATLLARALSTGELPDTDEGMAALAHARMFGGKKKR